MADRPSAGDVALCGGAWHTCFVLADLLADYLFGPIRPNTVPTGIRRAVVALGCRCRRTSWAMWTLARCRRGLAFCGQTTPTAGARWRSRWRARGRRDPLLRADAVDAAQDETIPDSPGDEMARAWERAIADIRAAGDDPDAAVARAAATLEAWGNATDEERKRVPWPK